MQHLNTARTVRRDFTKDLSNLCPIDSPQCTTHLLHSTYYPAIHNTQAEILSKGSATRKTKEQLLQEDRERLNYLEAKGRLTAGEKAFLEGLAKDRARAEAEQRMAERFGNPKLKNE